MTNVVDLFGNVTAVGIKVKLVRDIDRDKPCHDNIAVNSMCDVQCAPRLMFARNAGLHSRNGSSVGRTRRTDHSAPTGESDDGFRAA